jgi:hypothetical protein
MTKIFDQLTLEELRGICLTYNCARCPIQDCDKVFGNNFYPKDMLLPSGEITFREIGDNE